MNYKPPFHYEEIKKYGFRKTIKPRFTVEPNYIIFRDYAIGVKCTKCIKVINTDVICHQINVRHDCPKDIQFKISGDQRIIAGLHIDINVTFIPLIDFKKNKNNRIYEIHLISEHAKYKQTIPIIIASTIPSFTFPKEIALPDSSPNIPTYTTLLVYNTCLLEYKLKIQMEENKNFNFSYSPKHNISLKPNEAEVFIFEFIPLIYGYLESMMTVISDNGISNKILIKCNSYPCEVYITQNKIIFPETFIGLSEMKEFQIINNSDKKIKFKFMAFKSKADDKQFQELIFDNFQQYLHAKQEQFADLQYFDYITNREENKKFLERELQIGEQELTIMDFPFHSSIFEISPEEGELCPKTKQTICVFFKPCDTISSLKKDTFSYNASAYLKLTTNIDFRAEISFEGIALGPKIKMNIHKIDIGKIPLAEKHWYELVCYNFGIIRGAIQFDSFKSSFGGVVNVNPATLSLDPGKHGIFVLEYSGHKKGKFLEQIYFQIQNGENIEILISGEITPLQPIIIPSEINFGEVSMCICKTKFLYLKNLQSCPIRIDIEVRCHGVDEPLCFNEFINIFEDSDLNMIGIECKYDPYEENSKLNSDTSLCDDILYKAKSEDFNKKNLFEYQNLEVFQNMLNKNNSECRVEETIEKPIDNKSDINLLVKSTIDDIIKLSEDDEIKNKNISKICEKIFENIWTHLLSLNIVDDNVTSFMTKKWCIPYNPKEHTITPNFIIMEPRSACSIMISLIPNFPGKSSTDILMHINSNMCIFNNQNNNISNNEQIVTDNEVSTIKIPLHHICIIPNIEISLSEFYIQSFLELETELLFTLTNKTDADGFCLFKTTKTPEASIEFIPEKFYMRSKRNLKIKLRVTPFICGTFKLYPSFHILGGNNPIHLEINCESKPPVIDVFPKQINEINYPLFQKIQNKLFVQNITLTRARFTIQDIDSEYLDIYPLGGILGPHQSVIILINMCFCDVKYYKYKINIELYGGENIIVPICIKTEGISLQFDPDFTDSIDFGTQFLQENKQSLEYKVFNRGTKKHKLFFKHKPINIGNKEEPIISNFTINEDQLTVLPNEHCVFEVILDKRRPCEIMENYNLEAIIGKTTGRVILKKFSIIGKFIEPKLKWNVNCLEFNICFGEECCSECENVTVTNVSSLPIKAYYKTEGEFYINDSNECINGEENSFNLEANESKTIKIHFNYHLLYKNTEFIEYFGKVKLKVIDRPQQSLNLVTRLIYPIINVIQSSIWLYALKTSSYAYIDIYNPGPLIASYKWKFIDNSLYTINILDTTSKQNVLNVTKEILNINCDYEKYAMIEENEDKMIQIIDNLPELQSDEEIVEAGLDLSGKKKSLKSTKLEKNIPKSKTKTTERKTPIIDKTSSEKSNTKIISKTLSKSGKEKSKNVKEKDKKLSKLIRIPKDSDLIDISQIIINVPEIEIKEFLKKITKIVNVHKVIKKKISQIPLMTLTDEEDTKKYPNDFILIDQFSGSLEPLQRKHVSFSLLGNGNKDSIHVNYQFGLQLHVNNGNVTDVELNIINYNPKVFINYRRFEVGTKAWFETIVRSFIIQNISSTTAKICINTDKLVPIKSSMLNGYFKINPKMTMLFLDAGCCTKLNAIFVLGLGNFIREIGIEVNNNPPISILFSGFGQMPLFSILKTSRPEIFRRDPCIEYMALKTMFNEQVNNIVVGKTKYSESLIEKWKSTFEENEILSEKSSRKNSGKSSKKSNQIKSNPIIMYKQPSFTIQNDDFCEMCATDNSLFYNDDGTLEIRRNIDPIFPAGLLNKYDMDLSDYFILDYPSEYPNQININNYIEIFNVISQYNNSEEIKNICKRIAKYQIINKINSNNIRNSMKYEPPLGPLSFSILPLPLLLTGYNVNFGDLYAPQTININLTIFYHGPGKLNAALRTLVYIPGLKLNFFQPETCFHVNSVNKYNIVNYNIIKPDIIKTYININERMQNELNYDEDDQNFDKESLHAHSYDYDSERIHTRCYTHKKRKEINDYYTKLSNNIKEIKNPNIHSEIFQENISSSENEKINILITFKPTFEYYYDHTNFDDVIFLDIHLGPSIPIHLKGFIHYMGIDEGQDIF